MIFFTQKLLSIMHKADQPNSSQPKCEGNEKAQLELAIGISQIISSSCFLVRVDQNIYEGEYIV